MQLAHVFVLRTGKELIVDNTAEYAIRSVTLIMAAAGQVPQSASYVAPIPIGLMDPANVTCIGAETRVTYICTSAMKSA